MKRLQSRVVIGCIAGLLLGSAVHVVGQMLYGAGTTGNPEPLRINSLGLLEVAGTLSSGNNNIGDVDIASALPAGNNNIGDVDVSSIAAGTNSIGRVVIDGVNNSFTAQTAGGSTSSFETKVTAMHTAQLVVTGGPSGCAYQLEGSNDGGTTWFALGTSITCTSSAAGHVADRPARHVRGTLSGLTGGTTPSVTLHYAGK